MAASLATLDAALQQAPSSPPIHHRNSHSILSFNATKKIPTNSAVFRPLEPAPYCPNPKAVSKQIVDYLLSENAMHVGDAVLCTSDDNRIPVCSSILSIRSSYFKELFGTLKNGKGREVEIGVPERPLRQLLQFLYAGESDFVQHISNLVHEQGEITQADLVELIELICTTDVCEEQEFCDWLDDIIRDVVQSFPSTACVLLQLICDRRGITAFNCTKVIVDTIGEYPRQCFGVSDCVINVGGMRSPGDEEVSRNLLRLSAETLEQVFSAPFNAQDQEYLFGVLYYWATDGQPLSACVKAPDDAVQRCVDELAAVVGDTSAIGFQSRYARARQIAKRLSMQDMRVAFLAQYVKPTEIVEDAVLLEALGSLMMRNASPLKC